MCLMNKSKFSISLLWFFLYASLYIDLSMWDLFPQQIHFYYFNHLLIQDQITKILPSYLYKHLCESQQNSLNGSSVGESTPNKRSYCNFTTNP